MRKRQNGFSNLSNFSHMQVRKKFLSATRLSGEFSNFSNFSNLFLKGKKKALALCVTWRHSVITGSDDRPDNQQPQKR